MSKPHCRSKLSTLLPVASTLLLVWTGFTSVRDCAFTRCNRLRRIHSVPSSPVIYYRLTTITSYVIQWTSELDPVFDLYWLCVHYGLSGAVCKRNINRENPHLPVTAVVSGVVGRCPCLWSTFADSVLTMFSICTWPWQTVTCQLLSNDWWWGLCSLEGTSPKSSVLYRVGRKTLT